LEGKSKGDIESSKGKEAIFSSVPPEWRKPSPLSNGMRNKGSPNVHERKAAENRGGGNTQKETSTFVIRRKAENVINRP